MTLQHLFLAALTGLCSTGEGPATHYTDGLVLRVERQLDVAIDDVELWILRDGEETLNESGSARSGRESRHIVTVDRYLEVEDGRPVRMQRSFERIEGESVSRFGTAEKVRGTKSAFAGRSLELARSEAGEFAVSVEGEDPPASVVLDSQEPGLALDVLLPPADAVPGQTWELDDASLLRVLGCRVERDLYPRGKVLRAAPDREAPNPLPLVGSPVLLLGWPTWSGSATLLEETQKHAGESCRVVRVEARARAEAGPDTTAEGRLDGRLEGRLLISAASGRPLQASFEGEFEWTRLLPATDPADTETRLRVKSVGSLDLRLGAVVVPGRGR